MLDNPSADPGLTNPEGNKDLYDLKFTLMLKNEQKTVFETGYISAGNTCGSVSLMSELTKGTYDAELIIQPKRISDGKLTNNAKIQLKLIVK